MWAYKGTDESNSLTHWKYIKRTGTSGNYKYYYKKDKKTSSGKKEAKNEELVKTLRKAAEAVNFRESPPDGYEPFTTSEITTNERGRQGYYDKKGKFYEGDYRTAAKKKWKDDLAVADAKERKAYERFEKYNHPIRSTTSELIEKGKAAVTKILNKEKIAKQKEVEKKNIRRDRS